MEPHADRKTTHEDSAARLMDAPMLDLFESPAQDLMIYLSREISDQEADSLLVALGGYGALVVRETAIIDISIADLRLVEAELRSCLRTLKLEVTKVEVLPVRVV